jgi:hypothetical protein
MRAGLQTHFTTSSQPLGPHFLCPFVMLNTHRVRDAATLTYHLPLCISAKVKNVWTFVSTPSIHLYNTVLGTEATLPVRLNIGTRKNLTVFTVRILS